MSVRDDIYSFLEGELIGPRPRDLPFVQLNGEEVLAPEDPPRSRYGAGILFPCRLEHGGQEHPGESDDPVSDADDDGGNEFDQTEALAERKDFDLDDPQAHLEQEVNRANEFLPSALGITALVTDVEELVVRISAAQYTREEFPPSVAPGPVRRKADGNKESYRPWFRRPLAQEVRIPGRDLAGGSKPGFKLTLSSYTEDTNLTLHVYSRALPEGSGLRSDLRFVTFTLLNETPAADTGRSPDEHCFFQAGIEIEASDGSECFHFYPGRRDDASEDADARSLALLYRNHFAYAVGHGCAPDWDESNSTTGYAYRIRSKSLPRFRTTPIVPAHLDGLDLRMGQLAGDSTETLCRGLAEKYSGWIQARRDEVNQGDRVPEHLQDIAELHLDNCAECLRRMQRGIDLLEEDPVVQQAFCLMNKAMLRQQIHYDLSAYSPRRWVASGDDVILEGPLNPVDYDDADSAWRPFQLAFILMTLPSVALQDEQSFDERELVDVIWFPTGGGKTEAYLGLAAFTTFLRRIRDPDSAGTTVMMRYTLRLLTTQQFQRAASMICAMEVMRREEPDRLGQRRVSIGLWVGGSVTPNTEKQAVKAQNDLYKGEKENPFVVLNCPWCGAHMGPVTGKKGKVHVKGYKRRKRPDRIRLVCEDPDCSFSDHEGLPLQVIDEEIYSDPPTLLIGTVDKFALLPWRPEARSLFGLTDDRCSAPDLIIQDELHLISGPLGSMVGHYETVIDALCCKEVQGRQVPAKIVASTATIARAGEQIAALYGRPPEKAKLFPPQGLDVGDSFFSKLGDNASAREYIGVFGSGFPSQVTTQVRVMSALLQAPALSRAEGKDADPYWTLMTYFNSIRELGHAATLLQADISEYLKVTRRRLAISREWGDERARSARLLDQRNSMELTSRIENSEVPGVFRRLSVELNQGAEPVDVCLATNMIQVGIDVSRLGLMAVVGQPKTVSEYIQATSRVGRKDGKPGLVVTVLNPGKPRDRSHFERFPEFHNSIYRLVEPTSVTPFAVPVRERALHAIVIALCRYWGSGDLAELPSPPPDDALETAVIESILARVRAVDPDEETETALQLERIFREWRRRPPDTYGSFGEQTDELPMMYPAGTVPRPTWDRRARETPTSMRSVDAECQAKPLTIYYPVTDSQE